MPGSETAPENKNRLMHALLRFENGGAIMLSGTMPGMPFTVGNDAQVCLDFDDVADMTKKFEALSVGGKVTMPLNDTFWGAEVRHAGRRARRQLDVQLRSEEELKGTSRRGGAPARRAVPSARPPRRDRRPRRKLLNILVAAKRTSR